MRKNVKTCIYAVTAILPVILSACSNKADDIPKSTKESTTTSTTFAEDTSSDITNTTVETTTEEDTTELISETEQEVINSTENITEQQQTQVNVQQTTTVTSVNSTPAPVQTTPRPTETTTPIEPEFAPNKVLLKGIKGIGEKYSYKGKEFIIDEVAYGDVFYLSFSIDISVTDTFTRSQLPFEMYCRYDIYNSNETCVKTGYFKFVCDTYHKPNETTNPSSSSIYLKDYYCNSAFKIDDLPGGEYTIVFSNYE